jgi:Na+-transporting NADH:ubiquinone oxidoreductase subunit F
MNDIILGSVLLVAFVMILAAAIVAARALLVPAYPVTVTISGGRKVRAMAGTKLLEVLGAAALPVPAACGGKGTCGQCRVTILKGGGEALPTERDRLTRAELAAGLRLACQVTLRRNLAIAVSEEVMGARRFRCRVLSSRTVSPLIREIVLKLPEGERLDFKAGAFVEVTAPAYSLSYSDFQIATEHRAAWDGLGLWALAASSSRSQSRAYSIANTVEDGKDWIVLLVRLALPPPNRPDLPPGVVSSWLFGLGTGDEVEIAGPFGSFRAREGDAEMVLIGGGVGMAPLRAIISDQLAARRTNRQISLWYGARTAADVFYREEFDRLARDHPNFTWTVALSEPETGNPAGDETGFVHEVVLRKHLKRHPAPEDCEYYLCGPPLMIRAVLAVLDDLGVENDHIFNDDFGS